MCGSARSHRSVWWRSACWLSVCGRAARPTSGARALLLNELVAQRVRRERGVTVHVHFLEDARAIGAHCLDADAQFLSNLRNAAAAGELAKYLELALGQRCMQRLISTR